MLPASQWAEVERQVEGVLSDPGCAEVLVSVVFAQPSSVVFRDLSSNYAYLDLRSGTAWNLYFAGYGRKAWGRFPQSRRVGRSSEIFSPSRFREMIHEVSASHEAALQDAQDIPEPRTAWRYSGTCDLVSLMAYPRRDRSVHWDWLSLRDLQLTDGNDRYVDTGLGEVVETLSDWRTGSPLLRQLAPGEAPQRSVLSLQDSLVAIAGALSLEVAGNLAGDLIKGLL